MWDQKAAAAALKLCVSCCAFWLVFLTEQIVNQHHVDFLQVHHLGHFFPVGNFVPCFVETPPAGCGDHTDFTREAGKRGE